MIDVSGPSFVVVGCPRSGTTLLLRLLAAHPDIAVLPELGWIYWTYEQRRRLTPDGRITPELVEHLQRRGFGRFTSLPVQPEELAALGERYPDLPFADLIAYLFDAYAARQGKRLAGNKTVAAVRHVATVHELWPRAKVIHLLRDGRDVALSAMSWRRAARLAEDFPTWDEEPVVTAALWWEWNVRLGREAGAALGPLYRELRYEELVDDPEAGCRELCDLLGVTYDDAMLRFHEGRTRDEPGLDAKHAWLPPTAGLRDWRTQLAPGDVERFEAAAGALLAELGYALAGDVGPQAEALAAGVRARFAGRPLPATWGAARPAAPVG